MRNLLHLLSRSSPRQMRQVTVLSATSGLASAVLLHQINRAAELVSQGSTPTVGQTCTFALALLVQVYANQLSQERTINLAQRLLSQLRLKLLSRLRHAELLEIERLGRARVHATMSEGLNDVALFVPPVLYAAQQGVVLLFSFLYIGWVSPSALLMATLMSLAMASLLRARLPLYDQSLEAANQARAALFEMVQAFVQGAKEIRLDRRRSDSLMDRFHEAAARAESASVDSQGWQASASLLGSAYLYVLLGSIIFLLPMLAQSIEQEVFKVVTAALFLFGPLGVLLHVAPLAVRLDSGLGRVRALEEKLASLATEVSAGTCSQEFEVLRYKGLHFSYRGTDGLPLFTSGPNDLEVRRGELLFIVGGNGSGKSTMLKLLTGLYAPDQGEIFLDDQPVTDATRPALRSLFSAVFADFRLFDRLYGLHDVDPARVTALLQRFGLDHKVRFSDGKFSTLALSTGQRKRLALIEAILEERPVMVLDEWAADQDAAFRDTFYTRILPELKEMGKTLLVVSHDDRWFGCADRIVRLDLGSIVDPREIPPPLPVALPGRT